MKTLMVAIVAAGMAFCASADLYMAGDSTMCNYFRGKYPQQGWGQALGWYMKDPAKLHNYAVGGMSLKTCRMGQWQKILEHLKPGDYVIIAFGHNDCIPAKADRYSTPDEFRAMMKLCRDEVKEKGASMIIATSVPHSGGITADAEGKVHVRGGAAKIGSHVRAACEAAKELNLPCLNLNRYAEEHLPELGDIKKILKLYMVIEPGEYDAYPNGHGDKCHLRDTGAFWFATAAVKMAMEQKLPVCKLFKNPKDVKFVPIPKSGPTTFTDETKDNFSADEVAYAGTDEVERQAKKDADANAWRREIMNLRREGMAKGMSKDEAGRWAAAEYRRRQAERDAKDKPRK